MELTLKINNKNKVFKSGKITFKRFREATDMLGKYFNGEFLGEGYPQSEMDEAVILIADYFGVTVEQFEEGYQVEDSTDFFILFAKVLNNIQLNDGKREVTKDNEGK